MVTMVLPSMGIFLALTSTDCALCFSALTQMGGGIFTAGFLVVAWGTYSSFLLLSVATIETSFIKSTSDILRKVRQKVLTSFMRERSQFAFCTCLVSSSSVSVWGPGFNEEGNRLTPSASESSSPPAEIWTCFHFFTGSLIDSVSEFQSGRSPDAKVTFWDVLSSCQSTSIINSDVWLTSSHLSLSSYHHLLVLWVVFES